MKALSCCPAVKTASDLRGRTVEIFQALGSEARLCLVRELDRAGEKCVCDLVGCCGLGWSTVSHHLAVLREAGIVVDERRGRQIFYRLAMPCVGELIRCLEAEGCGSQSARDLKKAKVLILCTGNSCRSHLAEGILRADAGDLFEVFSAGSKPAGYVHPQAVAVMAEIGIDISFHTSKHLEQFLAAGIDIVITVCDSAREACPMFPGRVRQHHWGFPDPPRDIRPGETEADAFRRIREQIRSAFVAFAEGYRDALALNTPTG